MSDKEQKSFQFGRCKANVVTTPDGKRHIELDCQTKEARDEAAAVFEEEVVIRVNPKVILEEPPIGINPPMSLQPEPAPVPDTRLNPTES
ncbi:hypothetical protein ES705_45945 [subsurface metagenome]